MEEAKADHLYRLFQNVDAGARQKRVRNTLNLSSSYRPSLTKLNKLEELVSKNSPFFCWRGTAGSRVC